MDKSRMDQQSQDLTSLKVDANEVRRAAIARLEQLRDLGIRSNNLEMAMKRLTTALKKDDILYEELDALVKTLESELQTLSV